MKIAAAQISCVLGDLDGNVGKIGEFATRAKSTGAALLVFPEMVDTGYSMPAIQKHARPWAKGALPQLQQIAKKLSISIIAGVSDRDGDRIYNAQVFVDRAGNVVGKYRKTHLVTAAPLDERPVFTAGDEFVSCKIDNFKIGMTICYDLRFPEVCRKLAVEHGATLIVNSSAWPFPRVEHLRVLALARAMENQVYVVIANRVGTDDGVTLCGSSVIVDPYGVVLAAASADREEIISAEISKEVVDLVRERMRVFDHRRPELYQTN
ncbi:MAG: carbon-nitrogen hydrolase family protein [Chthoniobacterales bacterium]